MREHTGVVDTVSMDAPDKLSPPVNLDLSASFADDGYDGGDVPELRRSLEAELTVVYSLGLEFQMSKMQLTP